MNLLGPLDPLGFILPVGVLERILVLERGAGGVDTAAVGAVLVLLLEVSGKVAAAHLGVPGAVPHVVAAAEADDVDVTSLVERLERLDAESSSSSYSRFVHSLNLKKAVN